MPFWMLIALHCQAGLTGDEVHDRAYLKEQMEKYKEHELSTEIIRACGRLFYDLVPEDKKEELAQMLENDMSGINAVLDEVRFNIFKKNYDRAVESMIGLVRQLVIRKMKI